MAPVGQAGQGVLFGKQIKNHGLPSFERPAIIMRFHGYSPDGHCGSSGG